MYWHKEKYTDQRNRIWNSETNSLLYGHLGFLATATKKVYEEFVLSSKGLFESKAYSGPSPFSMAETSGVFPSQNEPLNRMIMHAGSYVLQ